MFKKINIFFIILFFCLSCSKNEIVDTTPENQDKAFEIYKEAYTAMESGDLLFASRKFGEAELILPTVEQSAQASIMSSYCLYQIRFYNQAITNLEIFLKKYPASKYVLYAEYLIIISYYEQIPDEKKDQEPLLSSKSKIENFLKKFPDSDYSLDLKFKLDLIKNQLAAKEMYVAKYYIKTKKWIPAINRLKNILENYETTIFVEEALFRLVELNYSLGLFEESKKYASLLGYNYNSSEWFELSYKILNKNYELELKKVSDKEEKNNVLKKIMKNILN